MVGELRQLPAVDLRSEGAQDASTAVHSCMLERFDCSRFTEQNTSFYCAPVRSRKQPTHKLLRKLQMIL